MSRLNIPQKKPKGKELTAEQKKANREISRTRVKVEHAIGKFKVFRIVKDQIRAYKDNFQDNAIFLACGLSNFKIMYQ